MAKLHFISSVKACRLQRFSSVYEDCLTSLSDGVTTSVQFPASRGLSRRGKMKREETSDVFVTCDTILRTGLNLSASASSCWIWARAKILNGPIRVEDETTLRAPCERPLSLTPSQVSEESRRGEFLKANVSLFTSFSTAEAHVLWNLFGFMELLAYCDLGLFKDFLRKPSTTFLGRDVISFIHLSPSRSVETVDQSLADLVGAKSIVGSIIVSVQSNKARALHIKRNRFLKLVSFDQKFGRRLHQTTRRQRSLLSFHFASSWETSASREIWSLSVNQFQSMDEKYVCIPRYIIFYLPNSPETAKKAKQNFKK